MSNSLWWLEDFESKVSSKKVHRRAELYGYFYARKVFGLDSIMSDKDQNHLLDELQAARSEIDRLRSAIAKHRQFMTEDKSSESAFYDLELWSTIGPLPGGG
jgi:predicted ABC-type ATPase